VSVAEMDCCMSVAADSPEDSAVVTESHIQRRKVLQKLDTAEVQLV